jgi:hypothetical protein
VGVDEASSTDLGNLAELTFTCLEEDQTIAVTLDTQTVILDMGQGVEKADASTANDTVNVDCRSATMGLNMKTGYYDTEVDTTDPHGDKVTYKVKAGDKFTVNVSIDALGLLPDKDNPPSSSGGYMEIGAGVMFDGGVLTMSETNDVKASDVLLADCDEDDIVRKNLDDGATPPVITGHWVGCDLLSTAETQQTGDVIAVTLSCNAVSDSATTEITLAGKGTAKPGTFLVNENGDAVAVFTDDASINIECIGPYNNKDGDNCVHAAEETINELSQQAAGIDIMDPNVFDFPDGYPIPTGDLAITIGDVLAYVNEFGESTVIPPTADVPDVSNPQDQTIGGDDILRTVILFGISCGA